MVARVQGRNNAIDLDARRPKRAFKAELRDSLTVVSHPTLCQAVCSTYAMHLAGYITLVVEFCQVFISDVTIWWQNQMCRRVIII